MLDVWIEFGGLAGQLNHLSIVLRLAVKGNLTLSLIYDQELKKHAHRLDRRLEGDVDSFQSFSQENDEIERNIKTEWGKTKSKKTALSEKAWNGKKGAKGGKGQQRPDSWLLYQQPQQQQPHQFQQKGFEGKGKGGK